MVSHSLQTKLRYALLGVIGIGTIVGSVGYRALYYRNRAEDSLNYKMTYPRSSKGWKSIPHGPLTLFLYQQDGSKLLISGSVNQMIEEYNPTPDMKADALAQMWIDITRDNMPGWTAKELSSVQANGIDFTIIRRTERSHEVVTAFAVRGNTTVLITMSGRDPHVADVDRQMDYFRGFLENCSLTRTDLSRL